MNVGNNETITISVNRLLDFLRRLENDGSAGPVAEMQRLTINQPIAQAGGEEEPEEDEVPEEEEEPEEEKDEEDEVPEDEEGPEEEEEPKEEEEPEEEENEEDEGEEDEEEEDEEEEQAAEEVRVANDVLPVQGAPTSSNNQNSLIEIRSVKITSILNRIEKYKYTGEDLHAIDDFADTSKYRNANFFQQQVIFSFYKLVQNQVKFNPRTMVFEEVLTKLKLLLTKDGQSGRADVFTTCRANAI